MQQHDIPELTPDEELDRTRVLPDPVDPLEGSARLPELRPEDEPGPEDEPEVPQEPKRRGRVVRKIVKYFLFLVLAVAIVAAGGIGYLTVTEYRPAYAEDAQRGNVLREGKLTGGQTVRVLVEAAGRSEGTVNGRLDNNLVVEFKAPETLIGQWADVHVTGSRAALLVGELAE